MLLIINPDCVLLPQSKCLHFQYYIYRSENKNVIFHYIFVNVIWKLSLRVEAFHCTASFSLGDLFCLQTFQQSISPKWNDTVALRKDT